MNSMTAADRAGITYRQLDHWITKGWIKAAIAHPGHGVQRSLNGREVDVLVTMAALVKVGVQPERASTYARQLVGPGSMCEVGQFRIIRSEKAA